MTLGGHRLIAALGSAAMIAGLVLAPGRASATTGPSDYLPKSKFTVASRIEHQYTGQYVFVSAGKGSLLTGGAMGVEVSADGYLYGVAQFYGYDTSGSRSLWTAVLYNFHQVNQQMQLDILAPTGYPRLGNLSVRRAANGDLRGQIHLANGMFSIRWHKISSR
jgi:hypothetical protein